MNIKYLSLVTTFECHAPRNLLPVVDLPAIRRAASEGNVENFAEFVVCPTPLRKGDILNTVDELIEFIEVNRLFGANLFHFYMGDSAITNKQILHCMDQYERIGVIETVPWSIPADIFPHVPWSGHMLSVTECFYRMMYRSAIVIFQDLDELIVPTKVNNWSEMLEAIHERERKRLGLPTKGNASLNSLNDISTRIATYNFRNRFFPQDWAIVGKMDEAIERQVDKTGRVYERFRTLGKVVGEQRLFPWKIRSKTFGRPENILIHDIHEAFDRFLIRRKPELFTSLVDEEDGFMHHYRKPFIYHTPWTAGKNYTRIRDFTSEIVRRLHLGLKLCKS